jgi:hypothetical protein
VTDISATKDGTSRSRSNWHALSQAERDAAYDNNAAVKNSAALIAERNQASETLRASRKSFLDVPYGDREKTKIDLYPPPTRRHLVWSSCTAVTGSAIRAKCLPCWSKASQPMAGRLPSPDIRWRPTFR